MGVQVKLIPLFPRGRPRDGKVASFLDEVLIYAHVATDRAVDPRTSLGDRRTVSDLSDDECFGRLDRGAIMHLGCARRPIVIILIWRLGADDDQTVIAFLYRLYCETFVERRPTIMAGPDARHVIVLQSADEVREFEEYFTVNESGIADTAVGRIFTVQPPGFLPSDDVGYRLSTFLYEGNTSASLRPPASVLRPAEMKRLLRQPSLKGFSAISKLFRGKTR